MLAPIFFLTHHLSGARIQLSTNNCEVSCTVLPCYTNKSFITSTFQFLQKIKQFLNVAYVSRICNSDSQNKRGRQNIFQKINSKQCPKTYIFWTVRFFKKSEVEERRRRKPTHDYWCLSKLNPNGRSLYYNCLRSLTIPQNSAQCCRQEELTCLYWKSYSNSPILYPWSSHYTD